LDEVGNCAAAGCAFYRSGVASSVRVGFRALCPRFFVVTCLFLINGVLLQEWPSRGLTEPSAARASNGIGPARSANRAFARDYLVRRDVSCLGRAGSGADTENGVGRLARCWEVLEACAGEAGRIENV